MARSLLSFNRSEAAPNLLIDFKPKSDADYVARMGGGDLVKSRRHEAIVGAYGEWVKSRGFVPTTATHPRDLVQGSGNFSRTGIFLYGDFAAVGSSRGRIEAPETVREPSTPLAMGRSYLLDENVQSLSRCDER
jgi:hypothetical protein